MGFFSSFGRSIGGMFGIGGLLPESETAKLQSQLSQAQATLNAAFQSGMINYAKDNVLFQEQLLGLVSTNAQLAATTESYNAQISSHKDSLATIKLIITLSLVIVILLYLVFLPTN